MNTKQQKHLTLGDLIVAGEEVWGVGQAARRMRLAIEAHLVVLPRRLHFFASSAKGRFT
jgi:hypothetical protein